jgi:hypothetical protein
VVDDALIITPLIVATIGGGILVSKFIIILLF